MKIIEQRRRDEDAKTCLDCGGSENVMVEISVMKYPSAFLCMHCAEHTMPIPVYLCLSCAQEAGALAEEVRERGNDR